MSLEDYGWNDFFNDSYEAIGDADLEPARVTLAVSGRFRLRTATRERRATLAGRMRHEAGSGADLPTVGDWVAARAGENGEARIEHLLDRRTRLSRKVPGKRSVEQIVAANVELVIVVMGLDGDFNLRRVERYLTTIRESGARPVLLLNKTDLCDDVAGRRRRAEAVAPGVAVLSSSCTAGKGLEAVRARIVPGETAVLVGSSGAGKSTLINRLLGEQVQPTREVREGDDRGMHTTTSRELFRLPGGGLLIDSPGIRELQLWGGTESVRDAFEDLEALADGCRFRDCGHQDETGCAVQAAVADGRLAAERLESHRTLQRELRYLAQRQDASAQRVEKRKWRAIHREMRRSGKHRRR